MKIILPGAPIPQLRMRHANRGAFTMTYDPKAKEKNLIKDRLKLEEVLHSFDYPRISFIFYMPIPKGIRKKDEALYNSEKLKHDKKPDVDNLIKLYLDCMDGIVLQGDQKVSLGPSIKLYSPNPRTVIWIHETANTITPQEFDCTFLSAEELDIPSFSEEDFPTDWYILGRLARLQSVDSSTPLCAIGTSSTKLQTVSHQV